VQKGTIRLVVALVAISVAVAGLLVVLSLLVSGSQESGSQGSGSQEMFAGLPQDGASLGREGAPVTIQLYEDFQCPACGQFARETWPDMVEGLVKPGEVRLVSETLAFLGPDSVSTARAAIAAGEQDRYWQYAYLLFENQGQENSGYATDEFLRDLAQQTEGLDVGAWERARDADFVEEELQTVQQRATSDGVEGTPTLVISGPGGERKVSGAVPIEDIEAAVEEVKDS
jgi:protein-disulfide isomerase